MFKPGRFVLRHHRRGGGSLQTCATRIHADGIAFAELARQDLQRQRALQPVLPSGRVRAG